MEKLSYLNFLNPKLKEHTDYLDNKKNQLEIEKKSLENKNRLKKEEKETISKKLEEMKSKEKLEERKQIEFSEKIDELNQETDTLMDEIDKWQT